MKQFESKVAVITGGASGFGKEFARIGASLGMKLVLADVQEDSLDSTVAEFKSQGAQVIGCARTCRRPRKSRCWPMPR